MGYGAADDVAAKICALCMRVDDSLGHLQALSAIDLVAQV
jgi:hypothetical protein